MFSNNVNVLYMPNEIEATIVHITILTIDDSIKGSPKNFV